MQMQIGAHSGITSSSTGSGTTSIYAGRPDLTFAAALQKVSPQQQAKAKTTATNFEAMFINQMFSQMTSGLEGEGPFGNTQGTGVWRSMQLEQYSKSFAKAGGIGISKNVYRELVLQQANAQSSQGNS
jgi:peptidoglycan hydrolase FlgJ